MTLIVVALIAFLQAVVLAWMARMDKKVNNVNTAVNHADYGMPTLIQRIADQDSRSLVLAANLHESEEWRNSAISMIARKMGVRLPPQPGAVPVVEALVEADKDTLSALTEEEVAANDAAEVLD